MTREQIHLSFFLFSPRLKNNHFQLLLVIYYAGTGLVNCNSTWKSPFFPLPMIADQPQAPDLSGIGWFLLWMPQIQQHTWAVPNPCSTMCLFSSLLKQRTQVFETTKGLVTEVWKNDIPSMPGYTCAITLNHSCVLYVQISCCAYFHTEKGCFAFVSVCLTALHGCMCVQMHGDN